MKSVGLTIKSFSYLCFMLGLGTSIDRSVFVAQGGSVEATPIADDFFTGDSVQGTLSFTANQSAPDGSTGWLKGVFATEQTSYVGILASNFAGTIGGITVGSSYKISFDLFLSDGTNSENKAHWPNGPTTTSVALGGNQANQDITSGQATLFDQTLAATTNNTFVDLYIYWNNPTNDRPNAGAEFYIKNLKLENA